MIKNGKNHGFYNFLWFFKNCSNHQKSSFKAFKSALGLPRSHFFPQIPFLDPPGQIIGHIVKIQKFVKIIKIAILAKNSIFHKLADIAQNDDIWPEMGPWDVLEPFCTRIWHFYSFRSNFKKIQKNLFFRIFHL